MYLHWNCVAQRENPLALLNYALLQQYREGYPAGGALLPPSHKCFEGHAGRAGSGAAGGHREL